MRILGIDPGLQITGYGCIEGHAHCATLLEAGVFRFAKNPDRTARSVAERLEELDRDLGALLERLSPDFVGVEELFSHYKHPTTAIVMGHARGVILLNIQRANLPLIELKPTMVKKSLTGNGHASKEQMQLAIQARFRLAEPPSPPDVADALAIALCASVRADADAGGRIGDMKEKLTAEGR